MPPDREGEYGLFFEFRDEPATLALLTHFHIYLFSLFSVAQSMISAVDKLGPNGGNATRAANLAALSDESVQAMLRDKEERHARERRVAELLSKAESEQLDDDPTLWSFR